jgi:hypothetical protein
MEKDIEKGFVRVKSKSNENYFFDSKILNKKECEKIIKSFKDNIIEEKKFLEFSLVSGADIIIMISDVDHILYVPEKIMNKEKKVEEN